MSSEQRSPRRRSGRRPSAEEATGDDDGTAGRDHRIVVELDALLRARSMTLTELSNRTGITMANLSVLKNNKGRAIRMSTLTALCDALDVTPGDLLTLAPSAAVTMR